MSARLERARKRLEALQAAYRAALVPALRLCAAGQWGLLNDQHRDDPALARRLRPAVLDELFELHEVIASMRAELGYVEPFDLHARLLAERSARGDHLPGDPKRAAAWLDDLGL